DLDVLRDAAAACDAVVHLAFRHDIAFAGDFDTAVASNQAAIETIGEALAGSGKAFAIASGLAGLRSGQIATEDDRPEPTPGPRGPRRGGGWCGGAPFAPPRPRARGPRDPPPCPPPPPASTAPPPTSATDRTAGPPPTCPPRRAWSDLASSAHPPARSCTRSR